MEQLHYPQLCLYSPTYASKVIRLTPGDSAFSGQKPNRTWFTTHSASLADGEMSLLTTTTHGFGLACNQNPFQNERNAKTENSSSSMTSVTDFTAMLIDTWMCLAYFKLFKKKPKNLTPCYHVCKFPKTIKCMMLSSNPECILCAHRADVLCCPFSWPAATGLQQGSGPQSISCFPAELIIFGWVPH